MKTEAIPPDVYIDAEAMAKLRAWTHHAEGEVSGLGLVEVARDGERISSLEVTDVFILEQECTSVSTELDPDAVSALLVELATQEKEDQLRFWWHSHANMGVFWSSNDESNIRRMATEDFLVSIVLNKEWKTLTRVDWFAPARVTLDDLPLHVLLNDDAIHSRCQQDVEELVTTPPPVVRRIGGSYRTHLDVGNGDSHRPPLNHVFADPFGYWDGQFEPRDIPFLMEEDQS